MPKLASRANKEVFGSELVRLGVSAPLLSLRILKPSKWAFTSTSVAVYFMKSSSGVARKKAVVQIGVAGGGLRQRNPDDESHLPRAGVGGRSGCAAEVERHEAVWQVPLEL
ncbi:hypothetical protein GW17_00060544 [Ensete ventricosum]|nr:hypothetical protein GW17_00060544 [Ensete ventricosum]